MKPDAPKPLRMNPPPPIDLAPSLGDPLSLTIRQRFVPVADDEFDATYRVVAEVLVGGEPVFGMMHATGRFVGVDVAHDHIHRATAHAFAERLREVMGYDPDEHRG